MSRTEPDAYGNPPFSAWQEEYPEVKLATFAEAAAHGEMVVNATAGAVSLEVLELAGDTNLNGKILIDVDNPLDFSKGMPPTLLVSNTDSLGEQIQRRFPETKVVKTLNTMNAYLMVDPAQLAATDHSVFVSGDDVEAKATVTELLRSFGWTDIIDLGDISTARGAETLLPIWLRLFGALQKPIFNFKIVHRSGRTQQARWMRSRELADRRPSCMRGSGTGGGESLPPSSGCKPVGTTPPGISFRAVVDPDGEVELNVAL